MFPSAVIAAPMAGGVSTPELVMAAGRAGGLGFLAGGYKTPEALASELARVHSTGVPFGVNLFVPAADEDAIDRDAVLAYRRELLVEAERYGVDLPDVRWYDDDNWHSKLDLLLDSLVPFVSFTFGCPDRPVIAALQRAGSVVLATVTTVAEARLAEERGVDALVVQHASAGGHSAAFLSRQPANEFPDVAVLTAAVSTQVSLPLIAAGGIHNVPGLRAALDAGAVAVQLGTAFLRAEESGTRAAHRSALVSAEFTETGMTRAFSGRPARGLVNRFMRNHADAPAGYPAIHHLTAPLRAAASAAGDPHGMSLWTGTGFRHSRAGSAVGIVEDLLGDSGQ